MSSESRALPLLLCGLIAVQLPWMARPVDIDEANFLVLAQGAAADPWRPHDVHINWQGTEQRAFDVLSNPPGVAWWLAPVQGRPIWLQRAWMLPWLALALHGALRLGRRFWDAPVAAAMVLCASPIVLLSTTALLPDAPLYACVLAGVAGWVDAVDHHRSVVPAALLAGTAALFRYSGLCIAPLLALYAWSRGRPLAPALLAWLPLALLGLHDWSAYGAWHLAAMGRFQAVSESGDAWVHKGLAAVAMLGGAGALPAWGWGAVEVAGGAVGALIGGSWAAYAAQSWVAGIFAAGGGIVLARVLAIPRDDERADRLWLTAWSFGGLAFLVTLRFMATRYWLPFLPGVLLSLPLRRDPRLHVALSLGLGTLLLADTTFQAQGSKRLADDVADLGPGAFTGHWGWQWELERRGWTALDEGVRPPRGELVAIPRQAWPQPVDVACARLVWQGEALPPLPWLPRAYSESGSANLHANWIAGPPMVPTVAPWTFASDPYESVKVCAD